MTAFVCASQEVQKRFPDGVPLLDPIDDMGIKDPALKKVIQKVEAFEHRMYTHPLHSDPNLEAVYTLCEKKALVSPLYSGIDKNVMSFHRRNLFWSTQELKMSFKIWLYCLRYTRRGGCHFLRLKS